MDGTSGKPLQCKAAVARKAGEPLTIEQVIVAPPKAGEARVKILCTSLCHTDVTFWQLNEPPSCFPTIFGHEAVGNNWSCFVPFQWGMRSSMEQRQLKTSIIGGACRERVVESVGEDVHEFASGDYVIPTFLADCGDCIDCKSPKSNLCSNQPFEISPWMPREKTSRFTSLDGETLHHFVYVTSFSQYTVVDIAHLVKVDPAIPPNRACLLGCGVSTGFGSAWKTASVEKGSTVAIFGLGVIGLAAAEGARLCGASKIIGVDLNPDKFELAKTFGVTDFVNPKTCGEKSVSQIINEMTGGGADACIECVGLSSLVHEAFACCRKGWGKTIVVGVDKPTSMLSFSSFDGFVMTGKSVTGCLFGSLKAKADLPMLVKRYLEGELQLDPFVSHEMKIEDVNEAFRLLIEGKCLRVIMWMD